MQPVVIAALQSATLTLISALITKTFTSNDPPILALTCFSLLNTPWNYIWQQFIESKFPAYRLSKVQVDDGGKGVEVEKKLNVGNTLVKFCLDQSIIAVLNVSLFLGGVRAMQGVPLEVCWQVVKDQLVSVMVTGYKLWPLVSLLNFTVVPVERRTLVGSFVGLGWGIFLAIKASR